jgi:hypothetical protein
MWEHIHSFQVARARFSVMFVQFVKSVDDLAVTEVGGFYLHVADGALGSAQILNLTDDIPAIVVLQGQPGE